MRPMHSGVGRRVLRVLGALVLTGLLSPIGVSNASAQDAPPLSDNTEPVAEVSSETQPEPAVTSIMFSVYRWASTPEVAGCQLPPGLLAAVGSLTSRHATGGGVSVEHDGTVRPPIFGPSDPASVDTDSGLFDLDPALDRAAGPFQFIPTTWMAFATDANGDGSIDPQNVWDAGAAAGALLCSLGAGQPERLDEAVSSYFGTDDVVAKIRTRLARYGSVTARSTTGRVSDLASVTSGPDGSVATLWDNDLAESARVTFASGEARPLLGDWSGDGISTGASFGADENGRNTFRLPGSPPMPMGSDRTVPLVGDWNADGIDDIGIFISGTADAVFLLRTDERFIFARFGQAGDIPVVGDWDGDGFDGPGVYRPSTHTFLLADQRGRPIGAPVTLHDADGNVVHSPGAAAQPLVGDWDGDGFSDLGLTRHGPDGIAVDRYSRFGAPMGEPLRLPPADAVLVGNWTPWTRPTTVVFDQASTHSEEIPLARVGGILVHADIADSLAQMIEAASADGVSLTGWGWRSHQRQIELRAQNCADVWLTPSSNCSPPTAIPGRSRHETGRAIDFHSGGVALSRLSPEFAWLEQHAATFGFHNLPSEPWHWSTDGH